MSLSKLSQCKKRKHTSLPVDGKLCVIEKLENNPFHRGGEHWTTLEDIDLWPEADERDLGCRI